METTTLPPVLTQHRLEGSSSARDLLACISAKTGVSRSQRRRYMATMPNTPPMHRRPDASPSRSHRPAHATADGGRHQEPSRMPSGQPCGEGAAGDTDPAAARVRATKTQAPGTSADARPFAIRSSSSRRGRRCRARRGGRRPDQQGRQGHQDDALRVEHPLGRPMRSPKRAGDDASGGDRAAAGGEEDAEGSGTGAATRECRPKKSSPMTTAKKTKMMKS